MKRHYRIDRFNGMDLLVCEMFTKNTWSQVENDAFFEWKEEWRACGSPEDVLTQSQFCSELEKTLSEGPRKDFYGLKFPIPIFNYLPSLILRGPVIDNRIVSIQVEYDGTVLPPVVCEEIRRFFEVVESPHWRNMISHQVEQYGMLFTSDND